MKLLGKNRAFLLSAGGSLFLPTLWVAIKYLASIDDRYLPAPLAVLRAVGDIEPSVITHTLFTAGRLIIGSSLGIVAGIALGLLMHRWPYFYKFAAPTVQSLRAVPPIATVPFFLLWFGFSELGRYLLLVAGIGFSTAIATHEIAEDIPEKYRVFFTGLNQSPRTFVFAFGLPRVLEALLPTVRFSVATAAGLVVVSELLGSQIGLGYLIQSARSTFATQTIFLASILLGVLGATTDTLVSLGWRRLVYWDTPRKPDTQPSALSEPMAGGTE